MTPSRSAAGRSDDPEDFRATLAEHLDELRTRIIRALVAIGLAGIAGWFLYAPLYKLLIGPVVELKKSSKVPFDIVYIDVTAPFLIQIKASMYIGLAIALPYIVYELWMFIRPGLRQNEVKPFRMVVPISLGLFFVGVAMGYWVWPGTIKWFLDFAGHQGDVRIIQNPYDLMILGLKLMLVFGLSFQLPLIVFFLARVGLISPEYLWRYWKQVTFGIFAAVAIFSPTADPVSMLALALPVSVLVFGSILAAKFSMGRKGESELNQLD